MQAEAYRDPYRRCENSCNHDLARGVLIEELLGGDGPYPSIYPRLNLRPIGIRPPRPAFPQHGNSTEDRLR